MTEIMPVPRNLILLSYQQGASPVFVFARPYAGITNREGKVFQHLKKIFVLNVLYHAGARPASTARINRRHAAYR